MYRSLRDAYFIASRDDRARQNDRADATRGLVSAGVACFLQGRLARMRDAIFRLTQRETDALAPATLSASR